MEKSALVIRSRGLRGYGAAIMMGFTAVWALIAAFAFQIWTRPAAFASWLILIILCAIGAAVLEVVFRLDYVKLAGGRLTWRYRQGGRGDQPVSAVLAVERIGNSAQSASARAHHCSSGSSGFGLATSTSWSKP